MSDDGREATIRALFPIVRQIAHRVRRVIPAADLDDLVGDGAIGLIRAVDTFDRSRGASLQTYARRLALGAMLNGLRRLDPISERVRRTLRRAERVRYALAQERGTLPTLAELERDDARLRRARETVHRLATLTLDGPATSADTPLDASPDPSERVVERDERRRVREALALLPERQRRILALHYGGELSLHAIGRVLRVSPQRVSQLHVGALRRLRQTLPPP